MTSIRVSIEPGEGRRGFAATTVAAKGMKTKRLLVPIGGDESRRVDVVPGLVTVEARLPSGDLLRHFEDVRGDQEHAVRLVARKASTEITDWDLALKSFAVDPVVFADLHWGGFWRVLEGLDVPHWLHRLVSADGSRRAVRFSPSVGEFSSDPRSFSPVRFQVAPRRVLALPLPWIDIQTQRPVHVTVNLRDPATGDLAVSVEIDDPYMQSVMAYLARDDMASLASFADDLAARAREAVRAKYNNPFAAAAGAYVLMRLRLERLMHDWPANLARDFEQLPDGAIIYGWLCLQEGRLAEARDQLLRATGRTPLFTEGVRLLVRGLARLKDKLPPDQLDDAFDQARIECDLLASHTQPDSLFTLLES